MAWLNCSRCSTSIGQARSSASQLTTLIQQVLESNLEISQRMAKLEMRTFGYTQSAASAPTVEERCTDNESFYTMRIAKDAKERVHGEKPDIDEERGPNADNEANGIQLPTFAFTFDQDLEESRPYARALKRDSVWSTASSVAHTMNWSCMSGLSLADVSEVSVIDLPISPQELWNGDRYILTDFDSKGHSEETLEPLMDGLAHGRDESYTKGDLIFYNRAQPNSASVDLGLSDREATKTLVAAAGKAPRPKKTILLGIHPMFSSKLEYK